MNNDNHPLEGQIVENPENELYEERPLTKKTIPVIARRAGKDAEDLELVRQAAEMQGFVQTVRYKVVNP